MKEYLAYVVTVLVATIAVSIAGSDKDTVMANEKAAWQAFKDKKADDFKKVVDKDIRCVYPDGVSNMAKELADMKKWEIKSFSIGDFDSFSDEKDVIVSTYTVKVEGTFDGKDVSGTYNAGSVWKKEGSEWLAICHTNILQAPPAK